MHKRIGNWQQLMEFMFKGLAVLSLKQVDSIMRIADKKALFRKAAFFVL